MVKLKSFTIIEVLITLIISAVIITVAYTALTMFNRQFKRVCLRAEQINQYRLLSVALQRDFERANWIRDTMDNRHFVLGCSDTVVYYSFMPGSFIQRTLLASDASNVSRAFNDTFRIESKLVEELLEQNTVGLLKQINIETLVNGEDLPLQQNKEYSAQQILSAKR